MGTNAMGKGNAGTSSAGQGFISTLIARMPYTYKVLQNALEQNPKYEIFDKLQSRPDDRLHHQSIFQRQPDIGGGHVMIDKRYHQFMYADVDVDKVRRVQEYRKMAAYAEMADAIDEIADEAIVKDKDGKTVKWVVEVKPYKESIPPQGRGKTNKTRIYETKTYKTNQD